MASRREAGELIRRVGIVVILAAAVWLVATHLSEVSAVVTTARGGSVPWLLVAVALQIGYYSCYALTYRLSFASAGIRRRFRELVPVVLASVFVGTVVPSGGTAGPGLIVDESRRRGNGLAASAAAAFIAQFADFAGFAVVMASGFAYLAAIGRLTAIEVLAASLFGLLVCALGGVLWLAGHRPRALSRLLHAIERATDRAARLARRRGPEGWADRFSEGFSAAAALASRSRRTVAAAWLVAVGGHVLDLGCFIAVGFAFGWHGVGALVAGYAVGIVVWLVSIVPQGVGIVEGTVALLLVSLGVPAGAATAISLTFRGLTFWLPFALGSVMLPRVAASRPADETRRRRSAARLSAVFVFAVGLVDILSALTPGLRPRLTSLARLLPFQVTYGHLAATLAGIALLMLARGLWHHKRTAFLLTAALLAVSAVSHLAKGLDWEEAAVALAVLAWLVAERDTFYARSDGPSIRQGLRFLAAASVATLAYGVAGFWLLDRHFKVNFGLAAALRQTVAMFAQFRDPGLEPITGFGRYFADSIYVVGAATFGFALVMLLRPVLVRHPASAADARRARRIVEQWGATSIAPMALLPDKAYWFSAGGSVVAYGVSGAMAVSLGDPVGPPADFDDALAGFGAFCARNGWHAVFYEAQDSRVEQYRQAGFSATRIGDDAVVDLGTFDLAGRSRKSLRHTVNSLEDRGYRTEVIDPPVPSAVMREMREVSDAWLAMVKGPEKRFALGWFDEPYLRACPIMIVRGPDERVTAFANLLSEFRRNEATIDLMRHLPDAPSGTMDYLFVRLFEWARGHGYETFDLGVSPLAGVGEAPDDPAAEKVLRLVYEHGSAFYGFKGLHEYKSKFAARWEPRYVVYPSPPLLPAALAAATSLNSGQNLVRGYVTGLAERLRPADEGPQRTRTAAPAPPR